MQIIEEYGRERKVCSSGVVIDDCQNFSGGLKWMEDEFIFKFFVFYVIEYGRNRYVGICKYGQVSIRESIVCIILYRYSLCNDNCIKWSLIQLF